VSIADVLDAEAAQLERVAARLRERAVQLRERVVPASTERRYLRVRDVAELIGVNARTVRRWRSEGVLPPALAIEGVVRWRAEDVEAWLGSSNQPSLSGARAGSVASMDTRNARSAG